MKRVLLTVSGAIDPSVAEQVAAGERPKPDYLALAQALDADLLDYTEACARAGRVGRLLERIGGPALVLAWVCYLRRNDYDVVFTDGEQVGIPFALLCKLGRFRRVRHLMIAHILSVRKKMLFFDWLHLQSHIELFLVYSSWQKRFIEQRWGVPVDRVVWTPFMVDASFFAPAQVTARRRRMICTAGLEFRDYATLMKAVEGLDVEVVIAAASPWSKRRDTTADRPIPANVTIRRFSQYELRQLYADSRFVVMPLHNVEFQAGVTAILEAMAMQRAVVCSQTAGQTDIIDQDETGLYVPPENPAALRAAIERLLANPDLATRLGETGREQVERELSLERYCERLRIYVHDPNPNPSAVGNRRTINHIFRDRSGSAATDL